MLDYLRTRRSPRLRMLAEPAPEPSDIEQILTIASRVPDHGKLVPWRFIVIKGNRRAALSAKIGEFYRTDHPDAEAIVCDEASRRLTHAPLVIAVVSSPKPHPKVPEWEQVLCAGAVCMNMLHAISARGFDGVWLTEWYAFDARFCAELGLTEGEKIAGLMHIGTCVEPRTERDRPAMDTIVQQY